MTDTAARAARSEGPTPEGWAVYATVDGKPERAVMCRDEKAAVDWAKAFNSQPGNVRGPYFVQALYSEATVERLRAEVAAAREDTKRLDYLQSRSDAFATSEYPRVWSVGVNGEPYHFTPILGETEPSVGTPT